MTEAVRSLLEGAIGDLGSALVDVEFRREPAGWVLRLVIDRPGGVTLDDCRRVSETAGTLLEVDDPVRHAYTLEVSSPGLTRPLARFEDWQRSVGSLVRVVTRRPIAGSQALVGRLLEAKPEGVVVEVEGAPVEVPMGEIARARLEVEWPGGAGPKPGSPGRPGGRGRGAKRRRGRTENGQ